MCDSVVTGSQLKKCCDVKAQRTPSSVKPRSTMGASATYSLSSTLENSLPVLGKKRASVSKPSPAQMSQSRLPKRPGTAVLDGSGLAGRERFSGNAAPPAPDLDLSLRAHIAQPAKKHIRTGDSDCRPAMVPGAAQEVRHQVMPVLKLQTR